MKFEEIVGFVITMLGMIYLTFRQNREASRNAENDEEIAPLPVRVPSKEFRKEAPQAEPPLHIYAQQPAKKVLPREDNFLFVHNDYHIHDYEVESIQLPPAISLEYSLRSDPSRAKTLINHLSSKEDLVILHDLFGPPRGL